MENNSVKESRSYLSFKLGDEFFASHISKVLSIISLSKIVKIPQTADYIAGVINLRGNVLPIIDVRTKFGMKKIKKTKETCIIVLSIEVDDEEIELGALVDSVNEVFEIDKNKIQKLPKIEKKNKSKFIKGIIKKDEDFIMLLDMDKIFSIDEILDISNKAKNHKK